ncbi:MAG: DUF971 domain-containing protein [Terriglobia bacterium]
MPPVPVKVKLDAGSNTLAIEWQDGHSSVYAYAELRERCPCSVCTAKKAPKAAPALPMFKPAARPLRAEAVGRYALQIFWSDGHSSGIYGFDYLRELCGCEDCKKLPR